jgi:hypothetical protein
MVFTARIRRSVVMPIDEPIAGCSPTKYRWSKERIETLALDDVASDYSKATQGKSLSCSHNLADAAQTKGIVSPSKSSPL